MKTIVIVIVLSAAALGGLYFFGGFRTLDPDKQGRAAKAAIKPGMTLAQVVAAAPDATPRYQTVTLVKTKFGEDVRVGPEKDFDQKKVQGTIDAKQYPAGFNLIYRFSDQVAFQVHFDDTGKVESIENIKTMADLLDTRKPD